MQKINITDVTSKNFMAYLRTSGISTKSIKFYKSDLSHFTGWLLLRIRSLGVLAEELTQAIPFLKVSFCKEYKKYLIENKVSVKTINRRLSTLRNLSRFFLTSQILNFDFAEGLTNISTNPQAKYQISPLVESFQKHLEAEKVSESTIKNYIADIRQFVSWIEEKNNTRTNQAQT